MNVKGFAGLKKKSAKEPKKKEACVQKPVDEFFPKGGEPSAVPADVVPAAAKRKATGKDVAPAGKKPKKAEAGKKTPPVLVVDEHSSSSPLIATATAPSNPPSGDFPREIVQFSLRGTAVMHDTVDPKAFLGGITSEMDREALGTYDDDALENRILRCSLTAYIALGEQTQRGKVLRLEKAQ
ncbi:unnamed protein product [Cuscuta europaea]|uniref:Uncharacterized protein n=1 Tax=Cuscuta europaea TaxID=41803 RepID=A0A9P0ZED1_CUSEU|nr:unnamed protein product [Cuscuta europaea]